MSVCLSIGRHEEYGPGTALPISSGGMVRAWLGTALIEEKCGSRPDLIISSPLPRAVVTAQTRAMSWGIEAPQITDDLHEDSDKILLAGFMIELVAQAKEQKLNHIHLVTHAPTIARINDGLPVPLNTGDVLIWKAPDWEQIGNGPRKSSLIRMYKIQDHSRYVPLWQEGLSRRLCTASEWQDFLQQQD